MKTADLIFKAIAHPARRDMISLLAISPLSVKQLTAEFSMSQPAVSQHLREMKEARLVRSERVGLEQRYRLTATPLQVVAQWTDQYRRFFDPAGHAWAFREDKTAASKPPRETTTKSRRRDGR